MADEFIRFRLNLPKGIRVQRVLCKDDKCQRSSQTRAQVLPKMKNKTAKRMYSYTQPIMCLICCEEFENESALSIHNVSHKKHICSKCRKVCSTETFLKNHMDQYHNQHLNATPSGFSCNYCNHEENTFLNIRKHINSVHIIIDDFLCNVCGHRSSTLQTLKAHELSHDSGKSYTCHICSKSFKLQCNLNNHLKTHTEQCFICSDCGKKLKSKQTLQCHQKYSCGKLVCKICGKEFDAKDKLINHLHNDNCTTLFLSNGVKLK